jgi:protein O-GlcNAc transferase
MTTRLEEALALHRAGDLDKAQAIYEDALRREPRNADVLQFLGLIALARKDPAAAIERIRAAIAIEPRAAVYHFNLGVAQRATNDLAGEIASYRRAIELAPDMAEAHFSLGNSLREAGEFEAAVNACRRATMLRPTFADAHLNLSRALHAVGRLDVAEAAARRALTLEPNSSSAHFQIGNVLQAQRRFPEAEAAYREVLRLAPETGGLDVNLGNVLVALGRYESAIDSYRQALRRDPNDIQAHFGTVRTSLHLGRIDEAIAAVNAAPPGGPAERRDFAQIYVTISSAYMTHYQWDKAVEWLVKAVAAEPGLATAQFNLALAYQNQGRLTAAATHYARVLEIEPRSVEARKNLALAHLMLGRPGDAIAVYRDGVTLRPDGPDFQRLLIAATMYDPSWSNDQRFAEARRFASLYGGDAARPVHANRRDPRRRIRIGYLSSDLRDHPIARNIEPLLEHRDRDRFEIVAYAEVARPDAMTARLRDLVDLWRPTVGLSDDQVAEQIRADGVDILVLLAGHLDENRPLVCVRRPAPVQISFHDVTTSCLPQIDYLIGDRVVCPRAGTERFSERVIRLPSIYAHRPLKDVPPVAPPPFGGAGHITFGSFNNPSKLNGATLALWAQVLAAVPGSRLLLKFRRWFEAPDVQTRLRAVFAAVGVAPERLEFAGGEHTLLDHLSIYGRIDIALDTVPFAGSTTTFEALVMGVPVVSLEGDNMMSRWSASILRTLGFDDLVADTPDAYVRTAVALASDPARLLPLRSSLRDRLLASPLVDGRLRARQIERVYRAVWARWCMSGVTDVVPA